ncbi:hypothetical protein O3M35_000713 [Rhynocoris fuscipes]|uniref:Uncharacterized protein n=1 Tax=Rhynocoris fuscipes TaxID=488301 RepID=A0AAW1DR44_9HEMI
MSEEMPEGWGRARGRARGRSRLEGPHMEQRRPGGTPSQQQPQQQQQQVQSEEAPRTGVEPRVGRARGLPQPASSGPRRTEGAGGAASLQMQNLSLGEPSSAAPTRGGVRSRRFEDLQIPTKPACISVKQGTSGAPTTLKSNYFKLQTFTEWALYQYRVDFAPDDERTAVRKGLLRVHSETIGPYIFDGTVLYAIKKLHPDPLELYSSRKHDDVKIRITIKKTTDLVMGDPNYIQFFNIVIRKCIAGLNLQLVGRDFFDAAMKVKIDKYNMELWPGYVTSVRQHERDVLLGVDLANKIMRKDTVLNLINELTHRSPDNWRDSFEQAIVGATVITPYNNKTYRIDDVQFDVTPQCTFEKGKDRISYMDYYQQRYQIRITNMNQPLLVSRPKARDIRGGRANNVILIPELCCMTGLTDDMRNNFHLMRALEEHTRLHPRERMDKVTTFMKRLITNPQAKAELSLWNLKFAPELVEFTGRVLAPERIQHGQNQFSEGTADADWTRSLRGHSMYHSKEFHSWAVVYLKKNHREVEGFCRTLSTASASLQFKIPPPNFVDIPDDRSGTYVQAIERIVAKSNPQLIMCIVPNNRADRYGAIKKKCYVDRAVPSQVVLLKNLTSKGVMSIATKIGIQVNCKIGGSPWSVVVPFKKPVMVVGFDVCHDTSSRKKSYGAMVASLDGAYSRYFSSASPHVGGEELSNEFGTQLVKAVYCYKALNGFLPPKIIIYRDGIGEGNEHYCLTHEVESIRTKLQNLYQGVTVQMAFVLVSKRINTRLFLNNSNPPPGTIADDVITNPIKYDFFLISQSVRQGTVAPTSYNVIYDTTQLSPDIMQKLTFKMTHLYFNWTGTVRVPAPVQYAHKLAFLCGQHLHRQPNEGLNELLYFL